ncbi:MAG: pseudouridine synthase [Clostridia bacterium]|nr:pseudouridine synthase [Clostridia bacterium]
MRLNRFLSSCGIASRRKCDQLIEAGKVSVNGKIVSTLGTVIDENKDKVEYNGNILQLNNDFVYYKLHKPKGYICSNDDEKGRKTIFDLIQTDKRLFSIGRLDYNTEGLIILTNDGDFANIFSHPRNEIEKEYIVTIEGKVLESELAVLRAGVIEDGKRMPEARVTPIKYDGKLTRLSIIIDEGQNHQVRRMFDVIGRTIVLLKRVRVGPIVLGGISRGEVKPLTASEIELIQEMKI